MSQELIGIIVAAIVLAGIIVTGQWALRRDMADLRKDIAALGERVVLRVIPVDRILQAGNVPLSSA